MKSVEKLRAIIVDDEQNARENLAMLIKEFCPRIEVVGKADGVEQGRELIESIQPDVVFLDIRMPSGAEGFDLLRQVDDQKFLVVFVTAFRDYALAAFNADAVHYLMKPIDIDELIRAEEKLVGQSLRFKTTPAHYQSYRRDMEVALQHMVLNQQRISVHHSRGIRILKPAEIVAVSADGNCSMIYLTDGSRFLDTRTLKTYDHLLPNITFFRVHRSHLINTAHIVEVIRTNGVWLMMTDGQKIPVSKKRLHDFLQFIGAA